MTSLARPAVARHANDKACLAVIAFAILQILTPVLPVLGIGMPIGSQSNSVRTLITPAGWAFSIWGALYTGSLLFAVYQARPGQRDNWLLARLRWPAAGAFLGNAVWAAYTQLLGLNIVSVAIIGWTLGCLIVAYLRITAAGPGYSTGERWLVVLPLSALAAWLTAATIVNVAASLRFHGIEAGEGAPAISALMVVIGGVIAGTTVYRGRGNLAYAIVFLWALAGIYAAGGQRVGIVAAATAIAALLVVAGTALGTRRMAR